MLNVHPAVFIMAVCVASGVQSLAPLRSYQKPVDQICDTVSCPKGQLCRVYRHCDRPQCHPEFICLDCVPDAADDECNTQGYKFAVLHGHPKKPSTLGGLECNAKTPCPHGSECVYHPIFVTKGMCCFGGPTASRPTRNYQKKCRVCVPECEPGYRCQRVVDECGEASDECKPIEKHGNCPNAESKFFKPRRYYGRFPKKCEHDQNCRGLKKCCGSRSGYKYCANPVREW